MRPAPPSHDRRQGPGHGTWSAFLVLPAVLAIAPSPLQTTKPAGSGAGVPPEAVPACADGIADQRDRGCLRASSAAKAGLLFPYPGRANAFAAPALVAGGSHNEASGGHAFVGGGSLNSASGHRATIGGGSRNVVTGDGASVVGGTANEAQGPASFVGGGYGNVTSGAYSAVVAGHLNVSGSRAFVGGGVANQAGAYASAVSGGSLNTADGELAAVPGGYLNTASGRASFAAGYYAAAQHDHSFVWGDGSAAPKPSSAEDQFNVYASGGTRIFSDADATSGVTLAPGAGAWSTVSDRGAKENFAPVDGREVLARLLEVPITTWNYRSQDDGVRHMGPVAQDFHAAFGLGPGDETIDTVDPDGVALAAIQGLGQALAERDGEVARLRAELAALREEVASLRR